MATGLLRQYRPTGTQFINDQALTPLLLEGAGNGWAQVAGSGSLKAVRSVEIVVSNRSPSPSEQTATMTLKFAPTAGFR